MCGILKLLHSCPAEIVWISTEWARINITMFGDDEAYRKFGKEFSFLTLSHRGDLDWVAGYIMGVRYNFIHVGDLIICWWSKIPQPFRLMLACTGGTLMVHHWSIP